MMKAESNSGKADWARICDICRAAACTVYCRADSAYLCTTCDSEIHSANPLAHRHQRVSILSSPGTLYGSYDEFLTRDADENVDDEDDDEAASWLLMNPMKNGEINVNEALFGGDVDEYLDLDDYNSSQNGEFSNTNQYNSHQQHYSVPHKDKDQLQQQFYQLGLEFEGSNAEYNYSASMSHSASLSSMDVGVVPESSTSDVSVSHPRPPKGTIDLFSGQPIQVPTQLSPMDREARVLRYREKKKTRKFEKTIRYASRKAYAETRPRIKGRFAKRNDGESEVDQMFSTSMMNESAYGVVPSY